MSETNGYKFLEFKEHPIYKSPEIKGRGINVGILWVQYRAWDYKSPQELADDRSLPLEAVVEALDWASKNQDIINKECEAGRRLLRKYSISASKIKELRQRLRA